MSDINSKLMKYRNINFGKYINEVLPTYEKSILLMEKDTILKLKKEVENEIFKAFVVDSYSLLEILDTYETVYTNLNYLKDYTINLKKLIFKINNKEEIKYINKKKLQKFRSLIQKFVSDVQTFDTGRRTLEYFDFLNSNNSQYILLMTNDILIIGKILQETKQYSLMKAIHYSVMDIKIQDDKLKIILLENEIVFKGDPNKLKKIYDKFVELNYEDSKEENSIKNNEKNEDLIKYILKTEKFELVESIKIEEFAKSNNLLLYDKNKLIKFVQICKNKKIEKDLNLLIINFLNKIFVEKLHSISKLKKVKDLIEEVFDYFYKFRIEEMALLYEIENLININKIKISLMIETQLFECIKFFGKRLCSKRFYSKKLDEIYEILRNKLQFDGFDYSYMLSKLIEKTDKLMEEVLVQIKQEIDDMINVYAKED